jgi:hypothetical protein
MFNLNQAFLLMQKLKSAPKGFTLGVKAELKKKSFSICTKFLINAELYGLVLTSRPENRYHQIWEANLQPLRTNVSAFINILTINVLAFISNLGAKPQTQNAQTWP